MIEYTCPYCDDHIYALRNDNVHCSDCNVTFETEVTKQDVFSARILCEAH